MSSALKSTALRRAGLEPKEIGAAYGVGESAAMQAGRRVAEEKRESQSVRMTGQVLEREFGL